MSLPTRIIKRPQVELDLAESFGYLISRNETAARAFLKEVRLAFDLIRRVPGIGRRWQSPHRELQGMRATIVSRRFHDYLVFYRPAGDAIEILRVLHGARDLTALIDAIPQDDATDDE